MSPATPTGAPAVAVIGGSGLYELFRDPHEVEVPTPYGDPSGPISVGDVAGRPVAFLPRHGPRHEHPPHRINYRANLWALRALGVRRVLAPCAVGGLTDEAPRGRLVVPDQVVDRTRGREATYLDRFEAGAVHPPFADPYCPGLRAALLRGAPEADDGGTVVVIEGPRFSTRAESRSYAAAGWSLVNMTGMPEASLARELGMCYASLAVVTDRDAGVSAEEAVDQAQVFAEFARNLDRVREVLLATVGDPGLDLGPPTGPTTGPDCRCGTWLDDVDLPFALPGTPGAGTGARP